MKAKWLAVLMGLLYVGLCTAHAEDCLHWVQCSAPTVCAACGAGDMDVSPEDMAHEWLFTDLGDMHQLYCLLCDYEEAPEEHVALCDQPDSCIVCGAQGLELEADDIIHDDAYIDLGTQHQYRCSLCGVQDEPENHWALCDDEVTCAVCGVVSIFIPDEEIYHDRQYVNLGEQHQLTCLRCGEADDAQMHAAVCTAPEACYLCGTQMAVADGADLLHFSDSVQLLINDDTHERCCNDCGFSWGVQPHQAACTDPTVCMDCGKAALTAAAMLHIGEYADMVITDAGHGFTCDACGVQVMDEPHCFDEGWCVVCGYEEPEQPAVPDAIPGDANGDGIADIMDALAILQYSVGWGNTIDQEAGDVNDDGSCDIMDALLILQYTVGWDVELL